MRCPKNGGLKTGDCRKRCLLLQCLTNSHKHDQMIGPKAKRLLPEKTRKKNSKTTFWNVPIIHCHRQT